MRIAPLFLLLAAIVFTACDTGPGGSLYDPDRPSLPDPAISNVVTDDPIVLAGIDIITIEGQNFSATLDQNLVYFENGAGGFARGEVIEASATRLRVKTPNFPGSALSLRVNVIGAENYSSAMSFGLTAAVVSFGDIVTAEAEELVAMTRSDMGDLVGAVQRGGDVQGIFSFDAASCAGDNELDCTRTQVAEAARPWTDIGYGTSGELFGVLGNRALYTIETTGPGGVYAAVPAADQPPSFTTLATGPGGVVWAAGVEPASQTRTRIYRFASDRSSQAFLPDVGSTPFTGVVRDLLVRDGALYVASETGVLSRVLRFPIDAASGALGSGDVVFTSPRGTATAIAFAADGTLFVGTSNIINPIYQVAPGGNAEILYPGVLPGPVRSFAWGSGTKLYFAKPVIPPTTADAPPTPADLFALETRRQGAP